MLAHPALASARVAWGSTAAPTHRLALRHPHLALPSLAAAAAATATAAAATTTVDAAAATTTATSTTAAAAADADADADADDADASAALAAATTAEREVQATSAVSHGTSHGTSGGNPVSGGIGTNHGIGCIDDFVGRLPLRRSLPGWRPQVRCSDSLI